MADYRLLYTDLVTHAVLGELPFTSLSHTTELNKAGSISATISLRLDDITAETVAPARTGLYVERGGVIVGNGLLWAATADPEAGTLSLTGDGLWSYYRHRTLRQDYSPTGVEQTTIAAFLIDHANDQPSGNIGVTAMPLATSWNRDRTWMASERKPIAELVEELAAVDHGFDFFVESAWTGGGIETLVNFSYPVTGRATEFVVELGRNAVSLQVEYDGTGVANVVDGFGSGNGSTQLLWTRQNLPMIGPYPFLEASVNHTDVSNLTTLDTHVQHRLTRGAGPIRRITAKVDAHDIVPGSFRVGDIMRVRASDGWLAVDDDFRVVSYTIDVTDSEQLTIQLAGLESFLES